MYRPPNSDIALFLDEYKQVVNKLKDEKYGNIVICLDHNLDFLKHAKHAPTRQFIESNLDLNLLPIITKPTRVTHESATLIDNIMISEKLQIKYKSGIMINDTSDHLPCYLTLPDETDHEVKKFNLTQVRKFGTKARAAIIRDLNGVSWLQTLENLSTNDSFECFHRHLLQAMDKHAPIKTIKIKNKRNSLPWLSNNIKRCINKNKELYKTSLASKSDKIAHVIYKEYNKVLTKVKRAAKISYFKNKCMELKGNGAKLWNLINNTVKKSTNKKQIIDKLKVGNIELTKAEEIANEFAKYYSTIGSKLMNKVKSSKIPVDKYINKIESNRKTLYLRPTTTMELEKIIMSLRNKTSTGFDEISNTMLKWLCPSIVFPLTIVFNKSLEEGVFPDQMKLSDVIPLYKNKDRYLCNNYHPISLLLTISKILEKVLYKRVYNFLQETSQITNNQFGFRSNHSCTDAITNLCSEIIKNKERGFHTLCVFLDLSKAFDTLSHNILLMKLEKYGLRGITLNWFSSYLSGRKLRSKVGVSSGSTNSYSDYYAVDIGMPQGSCLGPLLFLLYINDLNLNLEYSKIILFADDTTIFMGHRNLTYLNWCLMTDLQHINDWFLANKLTLNIDKSHYLHFGPKPTIPISIELDGIPLSEPSTLKFLGVFINNKLDWNCHINNLVNKLKRNLHLLSQGKNLMDSHTLKLIYHAHLESHILYGLPVWGSMCSQEQIYRVEKAQRKAVKQIKKHCSFKTACKELRILSFENLINLELCKLGYKLTNKLLPINVIQCLQEDYQNKQLVKKHRYPTRNKAELNIPIYNKTSHARSFLVRSISLFNKLPNSIKLKSNLSSFTYHCKMHLLTSE